MSFIRALKVKYQIVARKPDTKIAKDFQDFIELEKKEFVVDDEHLSLEKRKELVAARKKDLESKKEDIEKDVDNDSNLSDEEKKKEKTRLQNHLDHYEKGLDSMVNAKAWCDLDEVTPDEWKKKGLEPKGDKLSSSRPGGIASFAIPAGITCPKAGSCKNHCFALTGHTAYVQMVRDTHSAALGLSERDDFVEKMNEVIGKKFKNKKLDPKNPYRIHAWGDFYSNKYAKKWLEIIESNPNVWFYMYTKSFTMPALQELMTGIKKGTIKNAKVIQSVNGKDDKKIDATQPVAVVFKSKSDMDAWNKGVKSIETADYAEQKAQRLVELKKEIAAKDLPDDLKAVVLPLRKELKDLKKDKSKGNEKRVAELKQKLKEKDLTEDQKYELALLVKEHRKLKNEKSDEREKAYDNLVNVLTKLKILPSNGKFIECSDNDLVAADPTVKRIGIVEHGELHQPRNASLESAVTAASEGNFPSVQDGVCCEHMHGY
jgi:hypothetical protein